MLVVEDDLRDSEISFSRVCTLGVLYTRSTPRKRGFKGKAPEKLSWDVYWPTFLRTHGIGLTLGFSHCISPIKDSNVNRLGMVLYCTGRETVRA